MPPFRVVSTTPSERRATVPAGRRFPSCGGFNHASFRKGERHDEFPGAQRDGPESEKGTFSIHPLRKGGTRYDGQIASEAFTMFQSTPPSEKRRGDCLSRLPRWPGSVFNHALRKRRATKPCIRRLVGQLFQSTPLRKGRATKTGPWGPKHKWFSIHAPPRSRERQTRRSKPSQFGVSIHAPSEKESDHGQHARSAGCLVSIHAPSVSRATRGHEPPRSTGCFNPRPPKRERHSIWPAGTASSCFNPPPPKEGDRVRAQRIEGKTVSIHAPPKGRTGFAGSVTATNCFNPRPSFEGGEPTKCRREHFRGLVVSIHAPPKRRESDEP